MMYSNQYNNYSSLGRSHSHGFLPDLDAPIPSMDNEMEERQRLEREKQKLFYGSTIDVHSPIQTYSKPTDVTRINSQSAFDGLCVPFGPSHHDLYEDPWASRKKQQEEWMNNDMLPTSQPIMNKSNSYVNPFHTDVAPSLVFPVDAPQHNISPSSSLEDPMTPVSFIMSDDDDDIQQPAHKRQRGQHNTIYVKQEQEQTQQQHQQPFIDYIQQIQPVQPIQRTPSYDIQPTYDISTPLMPFTLQEQKQATPIYPAVYPTHQQQVMAPSSPAPTSHMSDSDDDEFKPKRKSTKRKSQPIGTHAIENTGAPVKMAKYLNVDGMTTQVWIEHATYVENGVTTDLRLICYSGAFNGVVVHAGDVGERIVCNRRSNISREFGQYASPQEKILIRVPSEHRPLGQTGNVLTGYGLIRFMQSKKMRKSEHQGYRKWLLYHVYPILCNKPFTFPKGHPLECETVPSTPFTEADFSH